MIDRAAQEFIYETTGLPVRRILKLGSDKDAEFIIEMQDRTTFTIGAISKLTDQNEWFTISMLYNKANIMPQLSTETWRECCKYIKRLIWDIEVAETNQVETVKEYLREYYEYTNPPIWYSLSDSEKEYIIKQRLPFIKCCDRRLGLKYMKKRLKPKITHLYFFMNHFYKFINNNMLDMTPRRKINNLLALAGAKPTLIKPTCDMPLKHIMAIHIKNFMGEDYSAALMEDLYRISKNPSLYE